MLGTVQFGMKYGIANRTGQPAYEDVRRILACAYEGGVNCVDTASAYGVSEEVLGKALSELGIAAQVVTVTKIAHIADDHLSSREAEAQVERSVVGSLRRLRLERLPLCLFHLEEDFRYIEALLKLKDRGLVAHIGCSVTTPSAAAAILASDLAKAIQIPANLLDQRFPRAGICTEAKARSVAVFVRSIYLQGLLLMPEEDMPSCLTPALPVRRKLQRLAEEAGMSLAELCVRYVLSLEGLTCALVGVETVEQIRRNLALFAMGPLDSVLSEAVAEVVPPLPNTILMPSLWPPHSKKE